MPPNHQTTSNNWVENNPTTNRLGNHFLSWFDSIYTSPRCIIMGRVVICILDRMFSYWVAPRSPRKLWSISWPLELKGLWIQTLVISHFVSHISWCFVFRPLSLVLCGRTMRGISYYRFLKACIVLVNCRGPPSVVCLKQRCDVTSQQRPPSSRLLLRPWGETRCTSTQHWCPEQSQDFLMERQM